MLYAEELRKSRDKAQVAFQEFALYTRKGKNGLFCFLEGKDNAYYIPRVKRFILDYHPIRCGGREKVLEVYKLINNHREYDKYKKAFFIDRDFNKPLGYRTPPIFETPCYSIENLYVSSDVFREILKNEFHLSEVIDRVFEVCARLFADRQKEFHDAATLFNAWYACLMEARNANGIKTGANLSDKLPRDFIIFNLQAVTANYTITKILETFPDAATVEDNALKAKIGNFSNCDACKIFRGKYEMQFLLKFIELIIKDSANDRAFIKERLVFNFASSLTNEQAINVFSAYAETPESLNDYLAKVTS